MKNVFLIPNPIKAKNNKVRLHSMSSCPLCDKIMEGKDKMRGFCLCIMGRNMVDGVQIYPRGVGKHQLKTIWESMVLSKEATKPSTKESMDNPENIRVPS